MARTNYQEILARVEAAAARCNRAGQVRLIAVSKAHPVSALLAAQEEGCRIFGENYAQEFLGKVEQVSGVEWHFIGHLQTNKVKVILPHVSLIHSVDRPSLLKEVNRRAVQLDRIQPILLEVNVGDESSKSGVARDSLDALVEAALELPGVTLKGLMAIPPWTLSPEEARGSFQLLRGLRDEVAQRFGISLPELSMGMSSDYEVAIEEGATLVRVGTAIFGQRAPK